MAHRTRRRAVRREAREFRSEREDVRLSGIMSDKIMRGDRLVNIYVKENWLSLGDDGKMYRCNDLIDLCYREMSKAILSKEWVRVKAVERVR